MQKAAAVCALVSLGCGIAILANSSYWTLENHNRQDAIVKELAEKLRAQEQVIFGWIESEGTNLEKDLIRQVIVAGDPIEKLLAKYPPDFSHTHPSFQFFVYSSPDREVTITAHRGFLAQATMKVKRDGKWSQGYFFGHDWRGPDEFFFALNEFVGVQNLVVSLAPLALTGPIGVWLLAEQRAQMLTDFRGAIAPRN